MVKPTIFTGLLLPTSLELKDPVTLFLRIVTLSPCINPDEFNVFVFRTTLVVPSYTLLVARVPIICKSLTGK